MHTEQGLSSEQSSIAVQGLLGCGRTWLFEVSYGRHRYISGRIKQSFYPRTRHGELKLISIIYAPPYLIRRSVPKVKSIARSHSDDNPGAHKTANTGKQATVAHYYYGATQHQEGITQHGNAIQIYRRERLLTV